MTEDASQVDSRAATAGGEVAPAVGRLVAQILELNRSDREALLRILHAVDGDGKAAAAQAEPIPGPQELTLDQLKNWLSTLEDLPPRDRLEVLQSAVNEAPEPWEREVLAARLAQERRQNAAVAAQLEVIRFATERPVLVFVGLLGIGSAIWYGLRGAWRLMF